MEKMTNTELTNWYRGRQIPTGFNGCQNRYGNQIHAPRRQDWSVGEVVSVGFLKNLEVTGKKDGAYTLVSRKGVRYSFTPHLGIERMDD